MPFFFRAASLVAVLSCAGLTAGSTAPGFANEISPVAVHNSNVATPNSVPAAGDVPQDAAALRPAVVTVQPLPDDYIAPGDDTNFATLSAAVAAQDNDLDDREMRCLASGIYHEAKSEPLAGQLAVAQTILNRTRSGRFASTVCGVLTQRGQFSFVRGGTVPSAEGRRGWDTAVAVAKVAMADLWEGDADEALYFHARRAAPGWRMEKVATIGNHVFYR